MIEPTLTLDNIFKILEIISILGGGSFVAWRLGRVGGRIEVANELQAARLEALENDVKALNKIITQVAVQHERINFLEKRVEELRHGEGIVTPLADALIKRSL